MKRILTVFFIFLIFSPIHAENSKKFSEYLEMMKSDEISVNFHKGVRGIANQSEKNLPQMEKCLSNPDQQIVTGCLFVLSRVPEYSASPQFLKLMVNSLKDDEINSNNLYIWNAYTATVWLTNHFSQSKPYLIEALKSKDLQQLALTASIIRGNDPKYNFKKSLFSISITEIAKNLNSDSIYRNASYASIILINIGNSFFRDINEIDKNINLDDQAKRLLVFIRRKIEMNDQKITNEESWEYEITLMHYLSWLMKESQYLDYGPYGGYSFGEQR